MIFMWFIYGLSFFALGFGILVYPKKGSVFILARHIWLIAVFGIFHGMNEWLDMFLAIGGSYHPDLLKLVRLFTLVVSFVSLLVFGVKVILVERPAYRFFWILPAGLLLAWTGIVALSRDKLLMGDIMARYLICVPGTFLTALALLLQISELQKTRLQAVIRCLQISAVVFLFYGLVAGIIVKKASFFPASILNYDLIVALVGFPIQIFRILCAFVLAGTMLYVLSVFHWETQQLIRRSEERFSAIASAMPLFLFAIDRYRHLTFAQGVGLKSLHLDGHKILGQRVSEVFDFLPQIEQDCCRALEGKEFGTIFRKDDLVFEAHYMPLRAEDGEMIGSMCLALDVTATTKAQEQLDDYRRQVEKNARLAEVGTLSAVMIGKLKDPLTVACLRIQRLLVDWEADPILRATSAVAGLKKCLSDISDAADIAYGFQQTTQIQLQDHAEPVDFYKIAKTMVEVFAQSARRANLSIILKDIDCYATISMPIRELEQIFFVLIQNAIHSSDSDKPQHLTISCCVGKDHIDLLFSDNCGGKPVKDRDEIFTPFLPQQQGTGDSGLGFAVVKRIVNAHKGDIRVESEPGESTTFLVTIPAESIL